MPASVPKRIPRPHGTGRQQCRRCHRRSLAGLRAGQGLCPYHWTLALWGGAWADALYLPEPGEPRDPVTIRPEAGV